MFEQSVDDPENPDPDPRSNSSVIDGSGAGDGSEMIGDSSTSSLSSEDCPLSESTQLPIVRTTTTSSHMFKLEGTRIAIPKVTLVYDNILESLKNSDKPEVVVSSSSSGDKDNAGDLDPRSSSRVIDGPGDGAEMSDSSISTLSSEDCGKSGPGLVLVSRCRNSGDKEDKDNAAVDPNKPIEQEMVDITVPFLDAVTTLQLGELLHDPTFGLFEAMSAIEMMDPKMDAGMVCNKGKRVIMNFDQAIMANKMKLEGFTFEEFIGIMDTTICCLVTWLEGHSLAQTMFTNLFLHKPTLIVDKYLKAFSVASLKLVDVIEACVSQAGVFEEEDFQPSVYGYNLASQFTDAKATSMLRECEVDIQKKIKSLKSMSKSDSHVDAEIEKLNAVSVRIHFIRLFHSLLLHLWKHLNNLDECPKLLGGCLEALAALQRTSALGLQRSEDESEHFMLGFELLVNQRLLPPTFPRSTRIKMPEEAFLFLEGLLLRIKTVLRVTTIQNFHGILEFFYTFSETQPCVLSRSLLQLLYGPIRCKKPALEEMMESMKESVRSFISPPILTNKSFLAQNKEMADCVEMFFDRCANPFAALLMAFGHNRARQRDKLAHLLEDLSNFQCETERIDAYIHSVCIKTEGLRQHANCFGTWLLYHITKVMIRYVLTGFELELYSVHEFAYIYWYLSEFLYGWLLSSLTRAQSFVAELDGANEKSGKKSAKNRTKTNPKKVKAYTKELNMAQAEQQLAGGYFKVMMGLLNDNKLPLPHTEFNNESVRYRHRFGAFRSIHTPSPVPYPQYKSIADLSAMQPSTSFYVAAARSFHQAKQYLEAIPGGEKEKEISEMLKVAKTNFIVVKLLASGHTKESPLPPEFDFSVHAHFPIIKVK